MATKITYATLGGDSLEDLHRELDAAIAAAPQTFGREHLLYINGKHVKADAQFDDRSPIDTSIAARHVSERQPRAREVGRRRGACGVSRLGGAARGRTGSRTCAASPTRFATTAASSPR